MNRALAVGVLFLVGLAGCSGYSGDAGDRDTVTPAAVPTDAPAPTPDPGLSAMGVENASALAAAHAHHLNDTSYTLHETMTVRFANGTLVSRTNTTTWVAVGGARVHSTTRFTRRPGTGRVPAFERAEFWADDDRVFVALTHENGSVEYRNFTGEGRLARQRIRTDAARIESAFRSVEVERTGTVVRDGTTLVVLEGDRPRGTTGGQAGPGAPAGRNVTLHALVDERGVVHEYRMAGTREGRGAIRAPVRTVRTVRYTDVGTTVVERPDWVDEAANTTRGQSGNRVVRGTGGRGPVGEAVG